MERGFFGDRGWIQPQDTVLSLRAPDLAIWGGVLARTQADLCTLYRELQREKAWSRIHLVPLLLAEGDRDAYRRQQAALEREKEIMKDVPGWEVRVDRARCGVALAADCTWCFSLFLCGHVHIAGGEECVPQPKVSTGGQHCGALIVLLCMYLLLESIAFEHHHAHAASTASGGHQHSRCPPS